MNQGQGCKCDKYCWHCGLNYSHPTTSCNELSDKQKERYQNATMRDTMDSSTTNFDWLGDYKCDHNPDW